MSYDPIRHAYAAVGGGKTREISLMHSNSAVSYAHEIWHWCPFKVSSGRWGRVFAHVDIVIADGWIPVVSLAIDDEPDEEDEPPTPTLAPTAPFTT